MTPDRTPKPRLLRDFDKNSTGVSVWRICNCAVSLFVAVFMMTRGHQCTAGLTAVWSWKQVSQDRRFVFVMIAPISIEEELRDQRVDRGLCQQIRTTHPVSGLYTNEPRPRLVWKFGLGWAAGPVAIASDGVHVVIAGDFLTLDYPFLEDKIAYFISRGKLLASPEYLEVSSFSFVMLKRLATGTEFVRGKAAYLLDDDRIYVVETNLGERLVFDVATGTALRIDAPFETLPVVLVSVLAVVCVIIIAARRAKHRPLMNQACAETEFRPWCPAATVLVASLLMMPLIVANIHGTWLLPTETNSDKYPANTARQFGWPISYEIRDIGTVGSLQWLLSADHPIEQVSVVGIAVDSSACIAVVACSLIVIRRFVAHRRAHLQCSVHFLIWSVLGFGIFALVFGASCVFYVHWFSLYVNCLGMPPSWPNVVLSWSLNACTASEAMCVPLAILILFQRRYGSKGSRLLISVQE